MRALRFGAAFVGSLGGLVACSLVVGVGDYSSGGGSGRDGGTFHLDGGIGKDATHLDSYVPADTGGRSNSCTLLDQCCGRVPSVDVTSCEGVAHTGTPTQCAQSLSEYQAAGYCPTSAPPDAGRGGSNDTGGGGGLDGPTTTGSCGQPSSTLTGFTPPQQALQGNCTMTETTGGAQCLVNHGEGTDAEASYCKTFLEGLDAGFAGCDTCLVGPPLVPGQPVPTSWGAEISFEVYGKLDDESTLSLYSFPSLGACLAVTQAGTSSSECGAALIAAEACDLYVCLPLCAISAPMSGLGEFGDCLSAASLGACASYTMMASGLCSGVPDSGPSGVCNSLVDQVTTGQNLMAEEQLLGAVCGGFPSGF